MGNNVEPTEELLEKVRLEASQVAKDTVLFYGENGDYAADAYVAGADSYRKLDENRWSVMQERIAQEWWDSYGFTDATKRLQPAMWEDELAKALVAMNVLGFKKKRCLSY